MIMCAGVIQGNEWFRKSAMDWAVVGYYVLIKCKYCIACVTYQVLRVTYEGMVG